MRTALKVLAVAALLTASTVAMPAPAEAASGQPSWCNNIAATQPAYVIGNVAYWQGTSGPDNIRPASGSWQIISIDGKGGNDQICGDPYKTNFLYGGDGVDSLIGGANADHVIGGAGQDYASTLGGTDTYDTEAYVTNPDTVHMGSGFDKVINCTTVPGCPPVASSSGVDQWLA